MSGSFTIIRKTSEGFDNGVMDYLGKVLNEDLRFSEDGKSVSLSPVKAAKYNPNTRTLRIELNNALSEGYGLKVEVK
jgi:hypothetical protein